MIDMNITHKERFDDFMVHFDLEGFAIKFEVYPVLDGVNLKTEQKNVYYTSKEDGQSGIIDFDADTCLKKLEGSYCWRGVWEGRLWFTDEEYWGEELSELSELYTKSIEPFCQSFINQRRKDEDG
jgi:hypothetical protein